MNAMVPRAGVPWWPFALIPEPAWRVAAALGRVTVHGIGDRQVMLELYLAEIGLASLSCLQQGTAAMGAGRASLSPCTQHRTGVLRAAVSLCSPCLQLSQPVRMSQFLMLSCSQQQVLSGTKAQPLIRCFSRQDGQADSKNLKPG